MPTATLQQLIDQRAALEAQIHEMQTAGRAAAIAEVRKLMQDNGLSAEDLRQSAAPKAASGKGKGANAGTKVAAKYRNVATGETWSGRGLKPKWMAAALAGGKKVEDFAIA